MTKPVEDDTVRDAANINGIQRHTRAKDTEGQCIGQQLQVTEAKGNQW